MQMVVHEEFCDLLKIYSDFRYGVRLYKEWKVLREKVRIFEDIGRSLSGVTLSASKLFPRYEDRKAFLRLASKHGLIYHDGVMYRITEQGEKLGFGIMREIDDKEWIEYDVGKAIALIAK